MLHNGILLSKANPLMLRKKTARLGCPHYSTSALLFMFFEFSVIGWLWETVAMFFLSGSFVNRGVLHGFWLPIYGFGGLLFLTLLNRFRQNPLLVFILGMITSGITEYVTSWLLEKIFQASWWDYSHSAINLNGRISFEGLIFFATAGCLILYFLAPLSARIIEKLPKTGKTILAASLVSLFLIDVITSFVNPNTGIGITC